MSSSDEAWLKTLRGQPSDVSGPDKEESDLYRTAIVSCYGAGVEDDDGAEQALHPRLPITDEVYATLESFPKNATGKFLRSQVLPSTNIEKTVQEISEVLATAGVRVTIDPADATGPRFLEASIPPAQTESLGVKLIEFGIKIPADGDLVVWMTVERVHIG